VGARTRRRRGRPRRGRASAPPHRPRCGRRRATRGQGPPGRARRGGAASRRVVTRLEVAPRAEAQIRCIGAWWRENRSAAPELFARGLASALDILELEPLSGAVYGERRGV